MPDDIALMTDQPGQERPPGRAHLFVLVVFAVTGPHHSPLQQDRGYEGLFSPFLKTDATFPSHSAFSLSDTSDAAAEPHHPSGLVRFYAHKGGPVKHSAIKDRLSEAPVLLFCSFLLFW